MLKKIRGQVDPSGRNCTKENSIFIILLLGYKQGVSYLLWERSWFCKLSVRWGRHPVSYHIWALKSIQDRMPMRYLRQLLGKYSYSTICSVGPKNKKKKTLSVPREHLRAFNYCTDDLCASAGNSFARLLVVIDFTTTFINWKIIPIFKCAF